MTIFRRKKKDPVLALEAQPTKERAEKAGGDVYIPADRGTILKLTMMDSPLERAHLRGEISNDELLAGQSYREHHYHGGQYGNFGGSWAMEPISVSTGGMYGAEKTAHHADKYHEARKILGRVDGAFMDAVICYEKTLEEGGYILGCKSARSAYRYAKAGLKRGLGVLVRLWG